MKKLLVVIIFIIPNFLVAQSIKPFTDYSMEELFTDEKAQHHVLEGCISLYSAVTELTRKRYPELASEFYEIAKKAKRKILIQINRANYRSKLISKTHEYISSIKVKATDTLIGHRQIYVASMGEGKTVVEKQRKSKAVDEIKKISEQILLELK